MPDRRWISVVASRVLLAASLGGAFVSPALSQARAESGYDGWLRYARLPAEQLQPLLNEAPAVAVVLGDHPVVHSAGEELLRGFHGLTGRKLSTASNLADEPMFVLGTAGEIAKLAPGQKGSMIDAPKAADAFRVERTTLGGQPCLVVVGRNERGVLYGTFALLRHLATGRSLAEVNLAESPAEPIRIVNQWDNLDGTIERGYGGRSIFWHDGHVTRNLQRVADYARLLASVGVNGCSINNVNADPRVISLEYLPEVAQIAEAMRPWGVQAYVSLNFAAPRDVGGVTTFDPLDPAAVKFWQDAVDAVYEAVPDLGGFVLKADSEGRLGPSEYGRTHADAANVIARAAKPHGGVLFYRGFVYNHLMDWRDLSNDRAKAAYDNVHPLDGQFDDNVVIQVKYGPIDFQVREPPSPLFSGLEKTNLAIELMICQEYLGQQKHLVYQAPLWKYVLDFDLCAGPPDEAAGTPVKELVAGKTFRRPLGGMVGVANVGRDETWLGHHLAMANLYAFGRLAWDPDLTSEMIAAEWTRQTLSLDDCVALPIVSMLQRSWRIYESYTGPLGVGTLTDIIHIHFGPGPESSEYNGWGQWHRADDQGVGMNRTVATGTKFIAQYRPRLAATFESLDSCPEDLLLFMHHVPYTHQLRSGKTVIQHFYDEHYAGAAAAADLAEQWRALAGPIDERRRREVQARLDFQAGHAVVWRDAVCRWFHKKSGIDDAQGRVGNYPNRKEAEEAELQGYAATPITPWEAASGTGAVQLPEGVDQGTAAFRYDGPSGRFDLHVRYFDEEDGVSRFRVLLHDESLDEWLADDHVPTPTTKPDSHSSSRRVVPGIALRPGDVVAIHGRGDAGERAAIDYLEFVPARDD